MNLYEVVCWRPQSGEPQTDAIYLVRARDFRSAVEAVVKKACPEDHSGEPPFINEVFEIGVDQSSPPSADALILRGPYFQTAYNHGWKVWERKVDGTKITDDWEERKL